MRIAIVTCHAGRVGGAESYLATVVPALAARGHTLAALFEDAGPIGEPFAQSDVLAPSWTARGDGAVALRALAGWNPDVLFVHGLQSLALEQAVVKIAPAVFFAHAYYGTCISGSKSYAFPARTTCTRVFGPACLAQFYPRRCGGLSPLTMVGQYRLQRGRLAALASYARILVASQYMAGEYGRHGLGNKVRVVPLPAPPLRDTSAGSPSADGWRLAYAGRLESTKGAPLLVDIASHVAASTERPVTLEIAGAGSLARVLESRARAVMAEQANLTVRFHGLLAPEACDRVIASSHLLLMPSCWPEPFGLAGLEAARLGVPAVAFDVGGIREWLVGGRTGVLVSAQPADAERFANAVARCLADPVALRAMGDRARAQAARFSVAGHVVQLERALAEVARSAAGAAL